MKYLVSIIIILSLSITYYHVTSQYACSTSANAYLFANHKIGHDIVVTPWRARVFSWSLSSAMFNGEISAEKFAHLAGLWSALWLAAALVVLAAGFPRHALLYIFGMFGALLYATTPPAGGLLYPWDGPALFGVTVGLVLARRNPLLLFLFVPWFIGFKETVIPLGIFILFWPKLDRVHRVEYFVLFMIVSVIARMSFMKATGADGVALQFMTDTGQPYLVHNLKLLFSAELYHPALVCGGLVLAMYLVPARDWMARAINWIGAAIIASLMITGCINEYRIFHELIPLALYKITTATVYRD